MSDPLVEYEEYRRAYSGRMFVGFRGNRATYKQTFRAPQGSFKNTLLTDAGRRIRRGLVEFLGRPPKHQGVAKGQVYFKWVGLPANADEAPYLVASDWVRDQGYEVQLVWMVNKQPVDPRYARPIVRSVKFVIRW